MTNQPPTGPEFSTDDFVKGYLSAFGNVYTHYYPGIVHLARELLQENTAVDSIVTDSFLKLWIKHADLDSPKNIEAFLHISVQRSCFSYLKQVELLSPAQLQHLQKTAALTASSTREKDSQAMKAIILGWFSKLPPAAIQVALLAWDLSLPDEKIADLLKISIARVKDQKVKSMLIIMEQWFSKTEKELAAFRQLLEKARE